MADEMTATLDIATAKMRLMRLQARTAAFHSRMDDAEADVERLHAALSVHMGPTRAAAGVPNATPAPPPPPTPQPVPAAVSVVADRPVPEVTAITVADFPAAAAPVVSAQAPPPPAST